MYVLVRNPVVVVVPTSKVVVAGLGVAFEETQEVKVTVPGVYERRLVQYAVAGDGRLSNKRKQLSVSFPSAFNLSWNWYDRSPYRRCILPFLQA